MRIPTILLLTILFFTVHSCSPGNGNTEGSSVAKSKAVRISKLLEPSGPLNIPLREEIRVKLALPDTVLVDSIHVYLGGTLKRTMEGSSLKMNQGTLEFLLPTDGEKTGKSGLRLRIYFSGGRSENQSAQLTFLSDIVPTAYSYTVVNEYPHDVAAYTQGLEYVDGVLYEGTGNYGTSSLRRVTLESGEVIKIRDMDQSLFGEGITVLGERIYQITYKSQLGFIYDKESFQEIQKVYYQNREGWGLTNNGKELIMSDGTNVIYFLDPEMFTINRQIEVYHDQGPADSLNELEYIHGKIWANRYFTDEIVIIDPESGKVEGRINLKGILKASDRKSTTDVLNGIAWDSEEERLFITGKLWPKLFEIKLKPLGG
jgi:glutaminyl-peptide cyclotransferase